MSLATALLISLVALFAFAVGVLGVALDILGRRVTSPTMRRMLPPGDLLPRQAPSLYAAAWAGFLVTLGEGIAILLLVRGIRFHAPEQIAAALSEFVAAAAVVVIIARATRPI